MSSGTVYQPATAAELIRSSQKDAFFQQSIRAQLLDIVSEVMGPYSARYEHEIDLIAKLMYFIPTTLLSQSTLGEEYCEIKPMSTNSPPSNPRNPSLLRRLLWIVCSMGIPYLYHKIRKTGRSQQIEDQWSDSKKNLFKIWNHLLSLLLKSDQLISVLLKVHLCYFYFYGECYEFTKYLCGIKYRYTGNPRYNNLRNVSYSALGRLLMIQFAISTVIMLYQTVQYLHTVCSNTKRRRKMIKMFSPKNLIRKSNFHLLFISEDIEEDEVPNQQKIVEIGKSNGFKSKRDEEESESTSNTSASKSNENDDVNSDSKSAEDDTTNVSTTGSSKSSDATKESTSASPTKSDSTKSKSSALTESEGAEILNALGLRFENEEDVMEAEAADAPDCILCLSSRRFPTVTECGHIFCWNCIADWCTNKVECCKQFFFETR